MKITFIFFFTCQNPSIDILDLSSRKPNFIRGWVIAQPKFYEASYIENLKFRRKKREGLNMRKEETQVNGR